MITPEVIADSADPMGNRLTTMVCTFHRFILSEFNTHRAFSRNSASSRAIPTQKLIEQVRNNPAVPIEFGTNRPGMQAGEPLTTSTRTKAIGTWLDAAEDAVVAAEQLNNAQVHKQVVNRILEPFMWHTVIVSATDWGNFFEQRDSELAQPEMHELANQMRIAYESSSPNLLQMNDWHVPFIQEDETHLYMHEQAEISAARCARVSYLTHDGVRDVNKDRDLFKKLTSAEPPHWSPLEHVAEVSDEVMYDGSMRSNFSGLWVQYRKHLGG